eukprot:9091887-Lingulodinium_polyedra.AAC.1
MEAWRRGVKATVRWRGRSNARSFWRHIAGRASIGLFGGRRTEGRVIWLHAACGWRGRACFAVAVGRADWRVGARLRRQRAAAFGNN